MSTKILPLAAAAAVLFGLALPNPANARNSYCCTDANGKLVCGDVLPTACHKRAYRVLDDRGRVIKEVEAPLSPEQRQLRDAAEAKKAEEAKKAAEEQRRNQALLATYPTEKDIDAARERALADFDKGSADNQKRYDDAVKQKKKLDAEKEFYAKKPMPANLKKQVEDNENALKTAQAALDSGKQERDALQAKYENEKKRYMELRYGKAPPAAAPSATDVRPR